MLIWQKISDARLHFRFAKYHASYRNRSSFAFTLDFSSLLKNHFECSFVSSECSLQSSECSLQSSNVCFEVPSEYLRWLNSEQFDWLTYYGSQSELAQLAHRKLSERTSKQTLELCNEHSELCNEHSELTNEHSKWFFKSELKSRVITPHVDAFRYCFLLLYTFCSSFRRWDVFKNIVNENKS